jgi:hypothetical protein
MRQNCVSNKRLRLCIRKKWHKCQKYRIGNGKQVERLYGNKLQKGENKHIICIADSQ